MAKKKAKKKAVQPTAPTSTDIDVDLAEEVNRQLAKRPMPKIEKKKKSKFQVWTLVMSIFMVVVMAGSVIYAAISALSHS
ncbi:DUF4044 domain-containing protein, partial [Fructobacillus ficulneus]|uniref:DUF4044 domain-containing protein n=1 Tax=Fructobacillus ficulneus TaxID=157463 RepID=UPI000B137F8D